MYTNKIVIEQTTIYYMHGYQPDCITLLTCARG